MNEKNSKELRMYEPFKWHPYDNKTYRIVWADKTHIYYKEYDRELRIEGDTRFSTPHRRVWSLWSKI